MPMNVKYVFYDNFANTINGFLLIDFFNRLTCNQSIQFIEFNIFVAFSKQTSFYPINSRRVEKFFFIY